MELEKNEKSCENCRYYSRYYVKYNAKLRYIHMGHCKNNNYINGRKKRPVSLCGYWEDASTEKDNRKRDIKDALISMSQRLDELTMLFKDEIIN